MVEQSFSLYIHIPFCSKKCPYCHFFVVSSHDIEKKEERFIQAILKEWDLKKHLIPKDRVLTLYFGGGTPTELSAKSLSFLIETFKTAYPTIQEITVEGNPESITLEKIKKIKEVGCNRMSIGVQSLCDEELLTLKRQHHRNKAKEAIFTVKAAGIENISIDLMYDIPGQTKESFIRTLNEIHSLPITHLSLYNLVIEENTPFKRIEESLKKKMPKEEDSFFMLQNAIHSLKAAGFHRYEISAFAKPGFESMHNKGYWESRPFIGLGPSAFSDDGKKRSQNVCHFQQYISSVEKGDDPVCFFETLEEEKRFIERFIIQLRLFKPICLNSFSQKQGQIPLTFTSKLKELQNLEYITFFEGLVEITPKGADFFEEIAISLL